VTCVLYMARDIVVNFRNQTIAALRTTSLSSHPPPPGWLVSNPDPISLSVLVSSHDLGSIKDEHFMC
jgi:hypothetical protein